MRSLFLTNCKHSQRLKPIPWKATIACFGISWQGCDANQSATAKAKKCLSMQSCYLMPKWNGDLETILI
jgi:hypothetical protein